MPLPAANVTRLACEHCVLADLCFPATLDPRERQLLEKSVEQLPPLEKGKELYRAGAPFTGLYVVRSGSFKAVMISGGGDEQVVSFCLPGSIIGYDGFEGHHASTVVALERSTTCFLPAKKFERLSSEMPSLVAHVHRLMGRDINAMNEMKLLIAQRSAEERLTCFLFQLADCFARRGFSDQEFLLTMSRHDIANFLGLAPETVSRLFTRLREEGVIQVAGKRVRILDAEKLKETTCTYIGQEEQVCGKPGSGAADRRAAGK